MLLNAQEASGKFDLAIEHITAKNNRIIDFSGIPLTEEQLNTISQALSRIYEPQEPGVEEQKFSEPLSEYNQDIEYILMNNCGLTLDNLKAIQDILLATRLHGLSLDDNELNDDILYRIYRSVTERERTYEIPAIKIWARGNKACDKYDKVANDFIEFIVVGESVASRIKKIYEGTYITADFQDEILNLNDLNDLKIATNNNPKLSVLKLAGIKIDEEAAIIVASMLESQKHLKKLDLDQCDLNDKSIEILYPALLLCKKLKTLYLDDNNITSIGASFIARLLAFNNLQFLTMNDNPIGDMGITSFASLIPSNRTLLFFELRSCMITAEGANKLIAAVQSNKKLQSLDLGGNLIGDNGLKNLTDGNLYLQYLALDRCGITDGGAKNLATTLLASKASLLSGLSVKHNKITDAGINGTDGLAAGLISQTNLEYCDFSDNPLGDASMSAIAKLMEEHFKLEELNLSKCGITDIGVGILATALRNDCWLSVLGLNRNNITDVGANLLATMLSENSNLKSLLLRRINLTNKGATAIQNAIANNSNSSVASVDIRKTSVFKHCIQSLYEISEGDSEPDTSDDNSSNYGSDQGSAGSNDTEIMQEYASSASGDTEIMKEYASTAFVPGKAILIQAKAKINQQYKDQDGHTDSEDYDNETRDQQRGKQASKQQIRKPSLDYGA